MTGDFSPEIMEAKDNKHFQSSKRWGKPCKLKISHSKKYSEDEIKTFSDKQKPTKCLPADLHSLINAKGYC